MDLRFSPQDEAYRQRLRQWLADNLPREPEPEDQDAAFAYRRAWQRKLYEGGWLGIHWPKEYGGQGATLVQQAIYAQEMARARAPQPANVLGIMIVGPTLIEHGTEEQKKRFIPKILSAEEIWCQGFSEPNAGSDLASLQTRAVLDGDAFVINGQKIWTSLGQYADWCILLARTDPDAPKHKGITFFLVDMHSPGITVRPLRQITGHAEFNEVFFDNVRVPRHNVVGEGQRGLAHRHDHPDVRAGHFHPGHPGAHQAAPGGDDRVCPHHLSQRPAVGPRPGGASGAGRGLHPY
ncbi:MAG: hypothetical protein KatS3mg131_0392 [Candidatus Tectimicrobiota bacterium]|nr:MAG: hypothetical protein KatS3mg131_0392 [Candidatus Tectomicrobia bacterium]